MGRKDGVVAVAKAKTPTIDAGTLAVDYGFALSVFKSNPELARIFRQAVAGTWSDDKFVAELRGTKWFKTTSDTAREWAILQGADPKTARQRLAARRATITAEAGALGISLNSAQLNDLTLNTIMFGWTDQQLRQSMSKDWAYNAKTASAGLAGQTVDKIKQSASDYLVPVSNAAINSWTQRVLAGTASADDFTEYAKQQARSLFPTMSAALDRGVTVAQFLDPYKQTASQTLGIDPESINWMDPKWRKAVDGAVDPKTKERMPMSLADWTTHIKTDSAYGYDKTTQARDAASQLTQGLAQAFGFMG